MIIEIDNFSMKNCTIIDIIVVWVDDKGLTDDALEKAKFAYLLLSS